MSCWIHRFLVLMVAVGLGGALTSCGGEEQENGSRPSAAPATSPPPEAPPTAPPPTQEPETVVEASAVRFRCDLPEGVAPTAKALAWWQEDEEHTSTLHPLIRSEGHVTIEVPPGRGILTVHVAGCVVIRREVDAMPNGITEAGTLILRRCTILRGRVIDEDGIPIDGAYLWPKAGNLSVPLTGTDEDGRFSFDGLPDGDVRLRIESDDHVKRRVVVRNGPGAEPETITLSRGGAVLGLVLDSEGKPNAEARVWIVDVADDANRDRMAFPSVEADGTFSAHLGPGRYRVSGRSSGGSGSVIVEVIGGGTAQAELVLESR